LRIPFAHNIDSFAHYGRLKDNEPGAVIYIAATGEASRQKISDLAVGHAGSLKERLVDLNRLRGLIH
jgi:hypothetical protein